VEDLGDLQGDVYRILLRRTGRTYRARYKEVLLRTQKHQDSDAQKKRLNEVVATH
jgi:hypothetical protein